MICSLLLLLLTGLVLIRWLCLYVNRESTGTSGAWPVRSTDQRSSGAPATSYGGTANWKSLRCRFPYVIVSQHNDIDCSIFEISLLVQIAIFLRF